MSAQRTGEYISVDRVLRDMLADARESRPERAWKESIMAAMFKARWGMAISFAVLGAVVAVAALIFIASPAFTEATDSYGRIALTGVVPVLAILAVVTAVEASSRVLKTPWGAALLGILGSVATSITYELWYGRVEGVEASAAPLLVAAGASIALNGAALAILVIPVLRQLPVGAAGAIAALVAITGGTTVLLFVFPIMSTVLIAAAALITVIIMRRAEHRPAIATPA
jgi:hypothetical protein